MKRIRSVALAVCIGLLAAGCNLAPTSSRQTSAAGLSTIAAVTPAAQSASSTATLPTLPEQTPPDATEPATETPTPTTAPTEAGARAPELLTPAEGESGSLLELIWSWDRELGADEWFELQIWPDSDDAEPQVYAWLGEPRVRITGARLVPGSYRWRVAVVQGAGEDRTEQVSLTSEVWTFVITRPSSVATISITPPTLPTRVRTATPWPTVTRGWTPPPTPTRLGLGMRTPTLVRTTAVTPSVAATATATPAPTPSATPASYPPPPPTPTMTTYPAP
ncbi:MAG: hypothetical protein ACYC4R_01370 [Anaerolineae bacterium]